MDELGIPELSTEQIETLCATAEEEARKWVLSKVSSKMVDCLDISIEAEGSKPLKVSVEIDLQLTTEAKDVDVCRRWLRKQPELRIKRSKNF